MRCSVFVTRLDLWIGLPAAEAAVVREGSLPSALNPRNSLAGWIVPIFNLKVPPIASCNSAYWLRHFRICGPASSKNAVDQRCALSEAR
jgi:hypothetical protein